MTAKRSTEKQTLRPAAGPSVTTFGPGPMSVVRGAEKPHPLLHLLKARLKSAARGALVQKRALPVNCRTL